MRLDTDIIDYFRDLSEDNGIPYQTLINLYLRECASKQRKLRMEWAPEKEKRDSSDYRALQQSSKSDEGMNRPFVIGYQELVTNHPKRLLSKALVVSVGERER